jgi:hypothetical protein
MTKTIKPFLALILLLLTTMMTIACRTPVVTPAPAPELAVQPTPAELVPFVAPTPASGLGTVTGRMVMTDPPDEPYLTGLYLGSTIYAAEGGDSPPLVSFSETDSPKAVQDPETGQFIFTNIQPGEYALIIWTPVFSMIVIDPATGEEVFFHVEGDQITDLGTIRLR